MHNIRNSVAAAAVALTVGISMNDIKKGLLNFRGVQRRFNKIFTYNNIDFYDDYAHHPTEIKVVLEGVNIVYKGYDKICVFQPHRISRLKDLKNEFSFAFKDADTVILCPIYAAGEKIKLGFNYLNFAKQLIKNSKVKLFLVKDNIQKVEQFVVLGAGFDLRSIRYSNDKLKVFELDKKNTQNFKLDTLKKAKIKTNNISYIECDLNNSDWSIDLIKQGFKKNKKTLFLFESVGCYLEENIVNNILSTINNISSKGSIVIQDLYSTRFLHKDEFQRVKRGKKLIQNFGENWNFTINMDNNVDSEISKLLEKNNLTPLENYICGKNSTKSKNPFYAISLSKV